ncbi:MAG: cytochrome c3 family protein [Gallionella sp.]|nr:cytochrome c3 family protein [Gallionella sp.]
MIRCLLVQITRNSRGQSVRKEQFITGETIQIGRAAECAVLLSDARVNLHHAVIRYGADGELYIDGLDGEDLYVNESFQSHARFKPGTQVLIGPYKLVVEPDRDENDLVFSIAHTDSLQTEDAKAQKFPLTLAATRLSKRRTAWTLSWIIALMFLLLPLVQGLALEEAKWMSYLPFSEYWNVGQMSHGHRSFGAKCNSCHQGPFEAVADKACLNCHKTPRHIQDTMLHNRVFKDTRCVSCHLDHRGEIEKMNLNTQCASCHSDIKKKNGKSSRANVHDFSVDHPAFTLTIKDAKAVNGVKRVSQLDKLVSEDSGLKYSHQVHLDKEGISSPQGDTVMDCKDCHQLDEAGIRFKPLSMEKSCQQSGCHSLDFKPPVPDRPLPHGSEFKLMTTLNEYYTKAAIDEMREGTTRRCGDEPTIGNNLLERAQNCANNKVEVNTNALFRSKEGCIECHDVVEQPDNKKIPWKIRRVDITRHWMLNAQFPHAKHSTAKCIECHDKLNSKKSSDVSLPNIGKCQECHVGKQMEKGKISSSCEGCHIFHGEKNQQSDNAIKD